MSLSYLYTSIASTPNGDNKLIILITFLLSVALTLLVVFLAKRLGRRGAEVSGTNTQISYSFESIINSLSDGVLLLNKDGTISHSNQSAATILDWSLQDIIGLRYNSVIKLTSDNIREDGDIDPISQSLIDAKTRQVVKQIERKGGKIFVDIGISPLLGEQSSLTGAVVILRNVNEQKKQEIERSDFISTASHEMRTPVAAIRGYLELALNPKICQIDNKAHDYLQKSLDATEHLGNLFQDLLTVSRSEDGRLPNHPERVDVNTLLSEIIDQIRMPAEEKGLKVITPFVNQPDNKTNVVNPVYFCFIDPNRFREVISNIFGNATKYTHQGSITVRLTGDSKNVSIDISDTGLGIPEAEIPHLFQKFYRIDSSETREIGGTGLGLFICKQIVEAMHGSISVSSILGSGATFTIRLPRVQ